MLHNCTLLEQAVRRRMKKLPEEQPTNCSAWITAIVIQQDPKNWIIHLFLRHQSSTVNHHHHHLKIHLKGGNINSLYCMYYNNGLSFSPFCAEIILLKYYQYLVVSRKIFSSRHFLIISLFTFLHRIPMNEAVRVVQMVVTILIFVVGVTLNGLVVWVLGLRRRRRRGSIGGETQGAGSFRIYVVNLALADLMLILRIPVMLGYLAHNMHWPFGKPVCQLVMFLRCLGLYVGAFLLSAIALERCLCMLQPVWARMRRPRWVVPLVCVLLWALASALSVPYITAAGLKDSYNRTQCKENVNETGRTMLFAVESAAGFLLPLVIFLTCNLIVVVKARRAESGTLVSSTPTSTPSSPTGSMYTGQRLTRLYRILFFTMLLFLTCWVPYFTCRFIKTLASDWSDRTDLYEGAQRGIYVSLYLVYIKSALNPILYVFAARGLSRTLRASLLSTIERIFNEELSESIRRKSLRRQDSQI